VKIKQLNWYVERRNGRKVLFGSSSIFLPSYTITTDDGYYVLHFYGIFIDGYKKIKELKREAQEHFESMINECIEEV